MSRSGFVFLLGTIGTIAFGLWQQSFFAAIFAAILFMFLGSTADSLAYLQEKELEKNKPATVEDD
jgi:hypothetical protein